MTQDERNTSKHQGRTQGVCKGCPGTPLGVLLYRTTEEEQNRKQQTEGWITYMLLDVNNHRAEFIIDAHRNSATKATSWLHRFSQWWASIGFFHFQVKSRLGILINFVNKSKSSRKSFEKTSHQVKEGKNNLTWLTPLWFQWKYVYFFDLVLTK